MCSSLLATAGLCIYYDFNFMRDHLIDGLVYVLTASQDSDQMSTYRL